MEAFQGVLSAVQRDRSLGSGRLCARVAQALFELAEGLTERGYDGVRGELREACRQAAQSRPSMAEMIRVGNDALLALEDDGVEGVHAWASGYLERRAAMQQAVAEACVASWTGPRPVLTHSNSRTVRAVFEHALEVGKLGPVWCTRSDFPGEGVDMARHLLEMGAEVHVISDAAVGTAITQVDHVVVGGDALQSLGVVNKVGTGTLALLALQHSRPVTVVSTRLKLLPPTLQRLFGLEEGDPSEMLSAERVQDFGAIARASGGLLHVHNPYYERVEYGMFSHVVTDMGVHEPDALSELVRQVPVASGFGW